jgi:hypothetical protein
MERRHVREGTGKRTHVAHIESQTNGISSDRHTTRLGAQLQAIQAALNSELIDEDEARQHVEQALAGK